MTNVLLFTSIAGEKEFKVEDFSKIDITGNFQVILIKSDENKVTAVNNDTSVDDEQLDVSVKAGVLKIGLKKDTFKERNITYTVYFKSIVDISAKKGCLVKSEDTIEADHLYLSCGNGGKIHLSIKTTTVDGSIRSGGSIKLSGTTENANFSIATGGNIAASNLTAKNVNATVTMGGEIITTVTDKLFATVKSGGDIKYKGTPKEVVDEVKLGGTIKKID